MYLEQLKKTDSWLHVSGVSNADMVQELLQLSSIELLTSKLNLKS